MALPLIQEQSGDFRAEICCECSIEFRVGAGFHKKRVLDGKTFYCPNGHAQYYTGNETTQQENERLKRQLETKLQENRMLRSTNKTTEARRRASQAWSTRRKKQLARVTEGLCPCCDEHFPDVARHMAAAHPAFDKGE